MIEKASGNTAAGAILGAAIGGAAGAYIGDYMDKQAAEIERESKARARVLVKDLRADVHYVVNEKERVSTLTEEGIAFPFPQRTVHIVQPNCADED